MNYITPIELNKIAMPSCYLLQQYVPNLSNIHPPYPHAAGIAIKQVLQLECRLACQLVAIFLVSPSCSCAYFQLHSIHASNKSYLQRNNTIQHF